MKQIYSLGVGLGILVVIIFYLLSDLLIAIYEVKEYIFTTIGIIALCWIIFEIYVGMYFRSKGFQEIKTSISKYIINCNELNHHIAELKNAYVNIKANDYGQSSMKDSSSYQFKRKEWSKNNNSSHVYNCSASVCKNSNSQPFKYLCKYFNIKADEQTLENIENTLNSFEAAEQGKLLLKKEKESLIDGISIKIPILILNFKKKRIDTELGFDEIDFSDLYFPIYRFQYVSSAGNSSYSSEIKLDIQNLNKFVVYLSEIIKFKNSVAGQRSLMTSVLREKIKRRDNYTCQKCSLSTKTEKNLLLEIDHVIPLSKGGITSDENLQTLCWRCNRSKGAKIERPLTNGERDGSVIS